MYVYVYDIVVMIMTPRVTTPSERLTEYLLRTSGSRGGLPNGATKLTLIGQGVTFLNYRYSGL